jgi:hypothetical protein
MVGVGQKSFLTQSPWLELEIIFVHGLYFAGIFFNFKTSSLHIPIFQTQSFGSNSQRLGVDSCFFCKQNEAPEFFRKIIHQRLDSMVLRRSETHHFIIIHQKVGLGGINHEIGLGATNQEVGLSGDNSKIGSDVSQVSDSAMSTTESGSGVPTRQSD